MVPGGDRIRLIHPEVEPEFVKPRGRDRASFCAPPFRPLGSIIITTGTGVDGRVRGAVKIYKGRSLPAHVRRVRLCGRPSSYL